MNLYDAWVNTRRDLTQQRQGDCGLFSFWYATVLLREIEPMGRTEVFPRKEQMRAAGVDPATADESLRHFAKATLKSGQGELLTAAEMVRVITRFGYRCDCISAPGGLVRRRFVSSALQNNRPVLIAYTKGATVPIDATAAMAAPRVYGTPGDDFGSHWSVLIQEGGGSYTYIDPHHPNRLSAASQQTFLGSNANVDSQVYVQFWGKPLNPADGKLVSVGATATTPPPVPLKKTYDIGQVGITGRPRAQKLANVMISIY